MQLIKFKFIPFVSAIIISLLAGIIGSAFTGDAIPTWYTGLNKPFFTPPNWIFAPVWTTLYILMGVSLYLVWTSSKKLSKDKTIGQSLFYMQLVLNALWSILFFGLQSPILAFMEIIILVVVLFLTIKYFYQVSKWAAYLLIPYFLWSLFATLLNFSIILLN